MLRKRLKNMQLSTALDKYYETVSRYKRGASQEFYRVNVIKRQPLAQMMMDKISSVDIADYRDKRLSDVNPKTGKRISGNTVRLEMALLSNLFSIARIEWGTCRSNPVELVRKPKPSPGRERRLSKKEERQLSDYLRSKSSELYCIFQLALETAMRQGEILSLKWANISSDYSQAFLPETKNGHARTVPFTKRAGDILKTMTPFISERETVFSYSSNGFKSAWRKAVLNLEINDLHFHDLRHEAISRFYELGTLTDLEISAISGHRTLTMLKRYAHIKTTYLVKKLNTRKKKGNTPDLFMPYPAKVSCYENGTVELHFPDFEELNVIGKTYEETVSYASSALLRELAIRLKQGHFIPFPSNIIPDDHTYTVISPV
jgi:integrase